MPSMTCASELTAAEQQKLSTYLTETGDNLLAITAGLSDAQWHFKPAADRWSIAEILEHVLIVERFIQGTIVRMPEAPPPAAGWNHAAEDEAIPIRTVDRTRRFPAPPVCHPTGNLSANELLDAFTQVREKTRQLVSAPALRGHVMIHPVAGAWDGYHWLLAAAAHGARHTAQMMDVKGDPDFPAR